MWESSQWPCLANWTRSHDEWPEPRGERQNTKRSGGQETQSGKKAKGSQGNVVKLCYIETEELVGDEDSVCGHKSRLLKPPLI